MINYFICQSTDQIRKAGERGATILYGEDEREAKYEPKIINIGVNAVVVGTR